MGILSTVLLWGLLGFLLAPQLLRNAILDGMGKVLVTRPTLERVRVNPFALTVVLERFAIPDARGRTAMGFERLKLGLDLFSPFRGGFSLRELRLTRPVANVALLPDSTLNLMRLIKPSAAAAPADTSKEPAPLHITRLVLEDGAVQYEDLTRTPAFQKSLQPIRLELQDFSTRRDKNNRYSLEAASEAGERVFWTGTFAIQPFRSEGTLRLVNLRALTLQSYMGELMPFDFTGGEIDFGSAYRFDAASQVPTVTLSKMVAMTRDLSLAEKESGTPLIQVARAWARGGTTDVGTRVVAIDSLRAEGLEVLAWMNPNNQVNYQSWAKGPVDTSATWTTRVRALDAHDVTAVYEDRRTIPTARFEAHHGTVRADGFSTAPGSKFPISFACSLGATGHGQGKGELSPGVPSLDLQLEATGFDLRSIQPYVSLGAKVDVLDGTADARGRLRFNTFGPRGPLLRFEGTGASQRFVSVDRKLQRDFLKWGRLELKGLALDVMPSRTVVREVAMTQPYIRAVVAPDRTTNFAAVAVPPDSLPPAFRSATRDTPYTQIDRITVRDGSMYFADLTLTPNFATGIEKLHGDLRELSSSDASHAAIDLNGQVDPYAPVKITGTLNPLNGRSDVNMDLSFKNIELTTFTPYSGKFAGYKVNRGKLNLDLNYQVHGRKLVGQNKIFLDQLTLGERVDSPDATKLPVRFAIALLKDSQGNIDLDIPVHGDLDDPKFSLGRIILQVLLNLLTKAVTSPFKLLGAAFGGGDDADEAWIAFAPGSATLGAAETLKVSQLAKGLAERPGLRLEVQECIDAGLDSTALLRRHFEERLRRARTGSVAGSSAPIGPAEYEALLTKVYTEQFGKLKGADAPQKIKGKRGDPAVDAAIAAERARVVKLMEGRVLASIHLDPGEVAELGRQRATSVRDAVVQRGGIAEERVFIVAAKGDLRPDSTGVRMGLLLTD